MSLIDRHFPAPNRKKLAKLLGTDTSFFDDLGMKLTRNDKNEIVTTYFDDKSDPLLERRKEKAKHFFEEQQQEDELDTDEDDFVDVSDIDSDDMDTFDDLMDVKLGLKNRKSGKKEVSSAFKFMDILLGPSASTRPSAAKKPRKKVKTAPRKPLKKKYENLYYDFDKVGADEGAFCEALRDELKEQIESFGESLPPNTLDELIDDLGGPDNVAEMTGRKGRVVTTSDGSVEYQTRSLNDVAWENLNLKEKQRFLDDEKRVAIISEAASSGISLHADRRAINQLRRVHLTLELPWSADRAIQQFGRTHRSNQVSAPEYVFLISNLAGEKRFASSVAKRLESLGALTHGDRRSTESHDLSQFNIDTKYGRQALDLILKVIVKQPFVQPIVPPPNYYQGADFFEDACVGLAGVGLVYRDHATGSATLEKDHSMTRFLNRILGLEVGLQNALFRYLNDTMEALIKKAKRDGVYESGTIGKWSIVLCSFFS